MRPSRASIARASASIPARAATSPWCCGPAPAGRGGRRARLHAPSARMAASRPAPTATGVVRRARRIRAASNAMATSGVTRDQAPIRWFPGAASRLHLDGAASRTPRGRLRGPDAPRRARGARIVARLDSDGAASRTPRGRLRGPDAPRRARGARIVARPGYLAGCWHTTGSVFGARRDAPPENLDGAAPRTLRGRSWGPDAPRRARRARIVARPGSLVAPCADRARHEYDAGNRPYCLSAPCWAPRGCWVRPWSTGARVCGVRGCTRRSCDTACHD